MNYSAELKYIKACNKSELHNNVDNNIYVNERSF